MKADAQSRRARSKRTSAPGKLSGVYATRPGKARTAILLWLLGVPIPLIALFFIIKSCVGG